MKQLLVVNNADNWHCAYFPWPLSVQWWHTHIGIIANILRKDNPRITFSLSYDWKRVLMQVKRFLNIFTWPYEKP